MVTSRVKKTLNPQRQNSLRNYYVLSLVVLIAVGCSYSQASAHTIPELIKMPEAFNQQAVTVVGEVSDVVTRYSDKPYTTFTLRAEGDVALSVFVWGPPTVKQGQVCQVAGTFFMEKVLGAYALKRGIEATKVERVPETENRMVSTIFKKKHRTGVRGARGFYIPQ